MNKQLMIGHVVRSSTRRCKRSNKKLDAGELGRIYRSLPPRGPFPTRIQDVGVVIDLAPHDVDIMRFLAGKDPTRAYSEIEQRIHTDHEDLLWATLRFPDGIIGGLEINWLTPTKIREVLVLERARHMFRADALTQDLYFYENSLVNDVQWATLQTIKGVSEGSMTLCHPAFEPLKAELQSFLKARRREPGSHTGDGLPL
ncbi:MAG: Gfo/Idh/MocA family oxidoreductase [Anaerolineales bacterium]